MRKMAGVASAFAWLIGVGLAATVSLADTGPAPVVQLNAAQSHYMEGCGGCHGILGHASKEHVPELRDEVGRFLCTPAGREYLIRLPNVSFANMDDQLLADVMNFVVFGLGGSSAPKDAAPYSAHEVAALRRLPLKNTQLARMRESILADAKVRCGG